MYLLLKLDMVRYPKCEYAQTFCGYINKCQDTKLDNDDYYEITIESSK